MKSFITILFSLLILTSCNKSTEITNTQDYSGYLATTNDHSNHSSIQINFWSKRIKSDSLQLIGLSKVAQAYEEKFQSSGDISQLKKAERALTKASEIAAIDKDNYLRALAKNYITQHRFREAKQALETAAKIGGNIKSNLFMQFDVALELGEYEDAKKYLEQTVDFSNFDYLTRRAKWEDHIGDLDKTIHYMERALSLAENSNKDALKIWTHTNLADYYGHAGRLEDSYNEYLNALAIDPNNAYAKKGIAWITYSHEKNPTEALRILSAIESDHQSPDYHLLKAEIYEYIGDSQQKNSAIESYMVAIQNPQYGVMYNSHTAEVLASEKKQLDQALLLAQSEVDARPTPQSYDLLANVHLLLGEEEKALHIAQQYIEGKTFEPMAHYHLAQIYKANRMEDKVAALKAELLSSSYELGPVILEHIQTL